MYTLGPFSIQFQTGLHIYPVLDPDGDEICTVIGHSPAVALLSHLNRDQE